MSAYSVPLRSTPKADKNIVPSNCFYFCTNWVASIYNAEILELPMLFFNIFLIIPHFSVMRVIFSRAVQSLKARKQILVTLSGNEINLKSLSPSNARNGSSRIRSSIITSDCSLYLSSQYLCIVLQSFI